MLEFLRWAGAVLAALIAGGAAMMLVFVWAALVVRGGAAISAMLGIEIGGCG